MNWVALAKMSPQERAQVCKDVHEKTGFGKLQDEDLKEAFTQDVYLKYSDSNYLKTPTQVLSCKKKNKEEYVYHLTKALDKDSVMLVYPTREPKVDGKDVFAFTRRDQIVGIPVLKKYE